MTTKIGVHVVGGSRDGYGELLDAQPAVVLAHGEGGALVEAKQRAPGCVTIFRHTLYPDAPHGIDQTDEAGAVAMAYHDYPLLRAQWQVNPADYYQLTNEGAGNEAHLLRVYIAYERQLMQLAQLDGYRVCVLNYAAGQPHWELWRTISAPFILEAWQYGHIYGRHVYGLQHGDLVSDDWTLTPFAARLLEEDGYLRSQGGIGKIAVTECGLDGGYQFDHDRFVDQMTKYEQILRAWHDIIGICCWTLGDWAGANWQDAIPAVVAYMQDAPAPPDPPPPPPPDRHTAIVVKAPQEMTADEWLAICEMSYEFRHTVTASHDDMQTVLHGGNNDSFVKVAYPTRPSQVEAIEWIEMLGFRWELLPGFEDAPGPFLANPLSRPFQVESVFNAPRNYSHLGGLVNDWHEGLDFAANIGDIVRASLAGVVSGVRNHDVGGYGKYVRIRSEIGGTVWTVWYTHLNFTTVQVGEQIRVGDIIGFSGNTGNSTGPHLHITVQKQPGGLPGYIVDDVVDPAPLFGLPPTTLPGPGVPPPPPPPPPTTIDLLPYILGDGRLYEVRNGDGGQERFQSQIAGTRFYQTKHSQWEEMFAELGFIWRDRDTSPGGGRFYRLYEGSVAGSAWVPRHWHVGGEFTRSRFVQFYRKSDCLPLADNSGPVVDTMRFVARYDSYTFRTGITLPDVIELLWVNGGERYFYALGFGLVGWERQHFDPNSPQWSAISEIHEPGQRPDNIREVIC